MSSIAAVFVSLGFVVSFEVIGFLAYKVVKLSKTLRADEDNLSALADCIIKLGKATQNVDVVEEYTEEYSDFTFPGKEGF